MDRRGFQKECFCQPTSASWKSRCYTLECSSRILVRACRLVEYVGRSAAFGKILSMNYQMHFHRLAYFTYRDIAMYRDNKDTEGRLRRIRRSLCAFRNCRRTSA